VRGEQQVSEEEEQELLEEVPEAKPVERLPRCGQVCYAIWSFTGEVVLVDAARMDADLEMIRQWNAAAQERWQKKRQKEGTG